MSKKVLTRDDAKTLNVWQKLATAREWFIETGVKKSGKNMALAFKYFELEDIVPMATGFFDILGLLTVCNFTTDTATLTVINCDNPGETIAFTSPFIMPEANKGMNPIQALGAAHTYLRRYLYLSALDICEADAIDGDTVKVAPPKNEVAKDEVKAKTAEPKNSSSKIPTSKENRTEIKKALTDSEGKADEMQIKALKAALKKLKEKDPSQESFIQDVVVKTEKFTNLTKDKCIALTVKVCEMMEALPEAEE